MKKIIIGLVVFTLLSIVSAFAESTELSSQIGVLDGNRMAKESVKLQDLQNKLNEKGKELSDKLEIDKANLSSEDFQREQQAAYDEFMRLKKDLELQFDRIVKQALEKVALKKNLTIIFKKNTGYTGVDVTTEVISIIDGSIETTILNRTSQIAAQYGTFDIARLRRESVRLKEIDNKIKENLEENQMDENDFKEIEIDIDNRTKRAVEKVSVSKGLKVVDKYAVVYGGIDVTDEVINEFDNESD